MFSEYFPRICLTYELICIDQEGSELSRKIEFSDGHGLYKACVKWNWYQIDRLGKLSVIGYHVAYQGTYLKYIQSRISIENYFHIENIYCIFVSTRKI